MLEQPRGLKLHVALERGNKKQLNWLDSELKHEVGFWAAHYERKLQLGSKPIFPLEAFVAKFMAIYKSFLINMFG